MHIWRQPYLSRVPLFKFKRELSFTTRRLSWLKLRMLGRIVSFFQSIDTWYFLFENLFLDPAFCSICYLLLMELCLDIQSYVNMWVAGNDEDANIMAQSSEQCSIWTTLTLLILLITTLLSFIISNLNTITTSAWTKVL